MLQMKFIIQLVTPVFQKAKNLLRWGKTIISHRLRSKIVNTKESKEPIVLLY